MSDNFNPKTEWGWKKGPVEGWNYFNGKNKGLVSEACENANAPTPTETMTCSDNRVIKVTSAIYGTENIPANGHVCQFDGSGPGLQCSSSVDLTSLAQAECNLKTSCLFRGNNAHMGDPCSGTPKYTRLTYDCVYLAEGLGGDTDYY